MHSVLSVTSLSVLFQNKFQTQFSQKLNVICCTRLKWESITRRSKFDARLPKFNLMVLHLDHVGKQQYKEVIERLNLAWFDTATIMKQNEKLPSQPIQPHLRILITASKFRAILQSRKDLRSSFRMNGQTRDSKVRIPS